MGLLTWSVSLVEVGRNTSRRRMSRSGATGSVCVLRGLYRTPERFVILGPTDLGQPKAPQSRSGVGLPRSPCTSTPQRDWTLTEPSDVSLGPPGRTPHCHESLPGKSRRDGPTPPERRDPRPPDPPSPPQGRRRGGRRTTYRRLRDPDKGTDTVPRLPSRRGRVPSVSVSTPLRRLFGFSWSRWSSTSSVLPVGSRKSLPHGARTRRPQVSTLSYGKTTKFGEQDPVKRSLRVL